MNQLLVVKIESFVSFLVYLRRADYQATCMEKARLVCRRFVGFIAESGHRQAIPLLKHGLGALLRTHLILHIHFFLSFTVVHDEGLLADRCLFVGLLRLLIHVEVVTFRPWLDIGAESRVQVLDPGGFLLPRGVLVRIDADRGLPCELGGSLGSEVRPCPR